VQIRLFQWLVPQSTRREIHAQNTAEVTVHSNSLQAIS
jgi:hypothetical protein